MGWEVAWRRMPEEKMTLYGEEVWGEISRSESFYLEPKKTSVRFQRGGETRVRGRMMMKERKTREANDDDPTGTSFVHPTSLDKKIGGSSIDGFTGNFKR